MDNVDKIKQTEIYELILENKSLAGGLVIRKQS